MISFLIIKYDASVGRFCSAFYIKNNIPLLRVLVITGNQTALHICTSYQLQDNFSSFTNMYRESFGRDWFFNYSPCRKRRPILFSVLYKKNNIPLLRVLVITGTQTALHICTSYQLQGNFSSFKNMYRESFGRDWFFNYSPCRKRRPILFSVLYKK